MVDLPKYKLPTALLLAHFETVNQQTIKPVSPPRAFPSWIHISAFVFVILWTFTSCLWGK